MDLAVSEVFTGGTRTFVGNGQMNARLSTFFPVLNHCNFHKFMMLYDAKILLLFNHFIKSII